MNPFYGSGSSTTATLPTRSEGRDCLVPNSLGSQKKPEHFATPMYGTSLDADHQIKQGTLTANGGKPHFLR